MYPLFFICFEIADYNMCSLEHQSFHIIKHEIHVINTQQGQYAGTAYNDCIMAMYHYSPIMVT